MVLNAEPKEGYRFICWTVDTPVIEGAEVLSEEKSGTFEIPYGSEPIANYVDEGHYVILYRTNGGATADGKDFYYQTFSNEHFYMPNTLHQDGTFVRAGYVLMRYTEKADGTGDYTTLGGKIEVNENGFRELYLKWGKATTSGMEFTTFTNSKGELAASIKAYKGYNLEIVVPETITVSVSGEQKTLRVERIESGAFANKVVNRLVLPATIHTVKDDAFSGCSQLSEITIHDNVWQISDESFSGCSKISTIYLNAGQAPTHAGSGEGLFCLKYERIRKAYNNGDKKIIVYSGSSSLYGFRAKDMQAAFNDEYTVINYGTNAGVSIHFYIEAHMRFFTKGDIIIQAPETSSGTQMGDTNITWRNFRGCEVMYEVFSYVDMSNYTDFFDSLCEFNQDVRSTMAPKSYEAYSNFIDEYTDLATNKDNPGYTNTTSGNYFSTNNLNNTRASKLNALYDQIYRKGAKVYMSWAPLAKSACNAEAMKPQTQAALMDKAKSLLTCVVISDIADYILEDKYFNNSNYHPGIEGSIIRTQRLIEDLKAQMEIDGIWSE